MLSPAFLIAASLLSAPAAAPALPAAASARAAEPNYASIMADRAPAMALLKVILSIDAGGQSQEQEAEAMALMIDGKGLLVMSGSEIGQRRGSSVAVKEIKVCIGDDIEGVPAKLIGRDSELDLAWVRIDKPADKGYSSIDLSKAASAKVGDQLIGLDKMGKYFDRTPVMVVTMVGGITKKPRELYIPTPSAWTESMFVGTPYFTAGGELVGMSVIQMPNADSEDGMRSRTGERLTRFDRGFKILPAAEIAAATGRAVEAEKAGKGVGMEEPKKDADPAAPVDKKDEPKPEEPKKEPAKKD